MANRHMKRCSNTTNHQGNAYQNYSEISPYTVRWLEPKIQEITSVGKNVEKKQPRILLMRMQIGAATMQNSMEVSQKLKNYIFI